MPLAWAVTRPLSAYSAMSSAVSTLLPDASVTRALLTMLACASGSVSIGIAVLFHRLTAALASMRVALPLELWPPARSTEPSLACTKALAPNVAALVPV